MKKIVFIAFLQSIIVFQTFSQSANNALTKEQFQDYNFIPGNFMRSLPGRAPEINGSFYIDDEWSKGTIYLMKGMKTEPLPLKYDVMNNIVEIKHEDKIKVLEGYEISKFVLQQKGEDALFSNVKNYKGGESLKGFIKIMATGTMMVGLHTSATLSKPNYNVALNVGDKDAKVIKKDKLYIITNGAIQEIPGKKSDFLSTFGDKASDIEKFMASKKYSFKNREELILIIQYYNSIAS